MKQTVALWIISLYILAVGVWSMIDQAILGIRLFKRKVG